MHYKNVAVGGVIVCTKKPTREGGQYLDKSAYTLELISHCC